MPIKKFPTVMPTIYDKFQCKGGACRSTCCQQWEIDITRAEYNKLRHRIKDEKMASFLSRLPHENATDRKYAIVNLTSDGYCPYLTDSRMCGMQLEYGYNTLPHICKIFPRIHQKISSDLYTYCLDTGCEATLELLWENSKTGIQFKNELHEQISYSIFADIQSGSIPSDYITDIHNLCIWILKNRSYSLSDRLIILGLALQELQKIQDSASVEQIPTWFMKWQTHTKGNSLAKSLEELKGNRPWFLLNNCKLLYLLSYVSPIKNLLSLLVKQVNLSYQNESFSCDAEQYNLLDSQFMMRFPNIDNFFENYMIFTIFRLNFPFQSASVWNSYLHLCSLYSLLRFVSVASGAENPADLIDSLVYMSRSSLNVSNLFDFTVNHLQIFNSNSLAHMAILLRG